MTRSCDALDAVANKSGAFPMPSIGATIAAANSTTTRTREAIIVAETHRRELKGRNEMKTANKPSLSHIIGAIVGFLLAMIVRR